jgi:hypothetical protein
LLLVLVDARTWPGVPALADSCHDIPAVVVALVGDTERQRVAAGTVEIDWTAETGDSLGEKVRRQKSSQLVDQNAAAYFVGSSAGDDAAVVGFAV